VRRWPTGASRTTPGCGLVGGGRGCGDLELPATPRGTVPDCCGLPDALATPTARLEREVAALAKPDPRVQALMVLPGVGKRTATTLVAEVGEGARFPSARKRCAWAGLTPAGAQLATAPSATATPPNRGSPWARGIGQEAAETATRHPCSPAPTPGLARRRGGHVATTAAARRLLARCVHVLTQLGAAPAPEHAPTGRARVFGMGRPHGRPA
jgi:hypothetical protein